MSNSNMVVVMLLREAAMAVPAMASQQLSADYTLALVGTKNIRKIESIEVEAGALMARRLIATKLVFLHFLGFW
jgi:hypothetical protein